MNGKKFVVILILGLLGGTLLLSLGMLPAAREVSAQALFFTPTPGPDGSIIYIVRENESCLSISLKNGVSTDQIISLNQLKPAECEPGATLEPGRQLILAVVEVLPTPTLTSTPSGPTPTPFSGNGKTCFILFEDTNLNGAQDAGEAYITGGTVGAVLPENASPPFTYFTIPSTGQPASAITGSTNQPVCIDGLPEGEYILTAVLPQSFQPTTNLIYPASLAAGQTLTVRFGAVPPNSPPPPGGGGSGGNSSLPLILGGILVLIGAGMGVYLVLLRRGNRKPPQNAKP